MNNQNQLMNNQNQLQYSGKLSKIYTVSITNLILKVITFFIYYPWAKTRMRRYLYSNISIFGTKLEYSGKGGEIFKSYIKFSLMILGISILIIIMLMILILITGRNPSEVGEDTQNVIDFITTFSFIFFLGYYAAYAGLGYKLSRTSWKGIKLKIEGQAKSYAWFRMKRLFINILSFGFLIGRTDIMARRYKVENIRIGNQKFNFDLDDRALDKINLITLLLAIPTLFISRVYYKAYMLKYFWSATSIENVNFKGHHSFGNLLWLLISNSLIIIFTLGVGIPLAINRYAKYFTKYIEISGSIEGSKILQTSSNYDARGEALEDISSFGSYTDIGL